MIPLNRNQPLKLALGEVHLWLFDARAISAFAQWAETWLPIEEKLRADVFPRDLQRRRYVGRRGALRHTLARYTGLAPQSLPLITKPSGKPQLAGDLGAPQFSLSASDEWVLLAVCDDQSVGVDLEKIQTGLECQGVARSFFDPLELLLLEKAPPAERDQLFFRAWTRAEAWLKMTGKGLSGLESLALRRPRELWLRDLRLPVGLAGALCLATPPTQVQWMGYPGLEQGSPAVEDLSLALAPLSLLER